MGIVKSALNLFGIKDGSGTEGSVTLDSFLETLPSKMGYDIQFEKSEKEKGTMHFEVVGDEAHSFLEENSNILEALAHVSMRIIRKQLGFSNAAIENKDEKEKIRVTFDSNGFKARKVEKLKDLAEQARQKVIDQGGKPFYVSALSPGERKVIHTHLAELGEVTSESIGKGNFKRVRVKLVHGSKHRKRPEGGAEGGQSRNRSAGGSNNNRGRNKGPRNNNRNKGGGNREGNVAPAEGNFKEVDGNVAVSEAPISEMEDSIGNRASSSNSHDSGFNS